MIKTIHPKRDSSVQSVERALHLLQLVSEQSSPISVAQLTELSGLNRATVWRLVGTLEKCNFLMRDPILRTYSLGFTATSLCINTLNQYAPLVSAARATMLTLWKETQESIFLAVPRHSAIYTIEQLDSPHTIRLKSYLHLVSPAHCSSNGKVLLAYLAEDDLNSLLKLPLQACSIHTVVDPILIRNELRLIRQRGYAMVCEEHSENENGISAPILKNDKPIAFLSVAAPSFRFSPKSMKQIAPMLINACKQVAENISL